MSKAKREYVALYGLSAWRERARNAKQIQRLRLRMRGLSTTGRPLDPTKAKTIGHGGAKHPLDCVCYDCLWGNVARMKRIASGRDEGVYEADAPAAARSGRVARSTGRRRHD